MTVPMMPSIGDTIQKYLPNLAKNIGQIIDPTIQASHALRDAIEKDPTLALKLREATFDNPDVIERTFGKGAAQFINGVQVSPEFLTRRRVAQAASNLDDASIQDAAATSIGAPTQMQRQQAQANLDTSSLQLKRLQQVIDDASLDRKEKERRLGLIQRVYTNGWAQKSMDEILNAFIRKTINADDLQGLMLANPDAMNQMLTELHSRRQFDRQIEVARLSARYGTEAEQAKLAYTFYSQARGLGLNPGAYMEANGISKEVISRYFPGTPYTPADVQAANREMQRIQSTARVQATRTLNADLAALGKMDVVTRGLTIPRINTQLNMLGSDIEAFYQEGDWNPLTKTGVAFRRRDANGNVKVLTPEEAQAELERLNQGAEPPPAGLVPGLSGSETVMYNQLLEAGPNPTPQQLAALEKIAGTPQGPPLEVFNAYKKQVTLTQRETRPDSSQAGAAPPRNPSGSSRYGTDARDYASRLGMTVDEYSKIATRQNAAFIDKAIEAGLKGNQVTVFLLNAGPMGEDQALSIAKNMRP